MNMAVNIIRPQKSTVNIPPSLVVWFWLCFSPIAHVENYREKERRVQFQRQRPAGKWSSGGKAQVTKLRWLQIYLHDCRCALSVSWPLFHGTLETDPEQNFENFLSSRNFPFNNGFSLPVSTIFSSVTLSFASSLQTFLWKHTDLQRSELMSNYLSGGNLWAG